MNVFKNAMLQVADLNIPKAGEGGGRVHRIDDSSPNKKSNSEKKPSPPIAEGADKAALAATTPSNGSRSKAQKQRPLPKTIIQALGASTRTDAADKAWDKLKPREQEILGYIFKESADKKDCISENTVCKYVKRISAALQAEGIIVNSRKDLAKLFGYKFRAHGQDAEPVRPKSAVLNGLVPKGLDHPA